MINKLEYRKMLPTDREIYDAVEKFAEETTNKEFDTISFMSGINWLRSNLEQKCSELTEHEQLAILCYKDNKLEAVKYLMANGHYNLKQANDFLIKHTED